MIQDLPQGINRFGAVVLRFFVHIFENIENHLLYTGLLFEKLFDGLHRNFGVFPKFCVESRQL